MSPDDLFHSHLGLCSAIVRRLHIPYWDREDALQEARLALWKAALKYDSSRDVKFGTFAYRCIFEDLVWWRRKQNTRIRRFGRMSLEGDISDAPEHINLGDAIPSCEDVQKRVETREIIDGLSYPAKLRLWGYTTTEIGMRLGHSKSWVSKTVKREIREIA